MKSVWDSSEDHFGNTDPKKMPSHFFSDALEIDYATALSADIEAQNFNVAPRFWYIDARFRCWDCGSEFLWSAAEQKVWFETYRFYVGAHASRCRACRTKRQDIVRLRKAYDALVNEAIPRGAMEQKRQVVEVLDQLEVHWPLLPNRMRDLRDVFRKQLAAMAPS